MNNKGALPSTPPPSTEFTYMQIIITSGQEAVVDDGMNPDDEQYNCRALENNIDCHTQNIKYTSAWLTYCSCQVGLINMISNSTNSSGR